MLLQLWKHKSMITGNKAWQFEIHVYKCKRNHSVVYCFPSKIVSDQPEKWQVMVINPRRACARVTVVVLCVCVWGGVWVWVCVCESLCVNSRLDRNIIFGPNNMQFSNYIGKWSALTRSLRRHTYSQISSLLGLPSGLFLRTEARHSSAMDKEHIGVRGSWLAGKVVVCVYG